MSAPEIKDVPKLLKAAMERLELKQEGLASRLGVDQPQISRWLKGSKPNGENFGLILALARNAGVIEDVRSEDVAADLFNLPKSRTVKLKGYVGAGSQAHFYALSDEDFEEVEAPLSATDQTVAVEIKGTSFGPLMDSWIVYYDDVRSPITEDLVGKICVVGLADDRILIKKIVSDKKGGFNLKSNSDEPDILNVDIEWAARVTDMKPRS
jgi:transcriptional regulator with XRE-family HTH domain